MVVTEAHAKTKECCGPPARGGTIVIVARQDGVTGIDGETMQRIAKTLDRRPLCTGSACMGWIDWTLDGVSLGRCGLTDS